MDVVCRLALVMPLLALVAACGSSTSETAPAYEVAVSATNLSVSPAGPQTVSRGGTASFTVTMDPADLLDGVGGNCPAGTWSGLTYTTGAIQSDCAIEFSATNIFGVTTAASNAATDRPGTTFLAEGSSLAILVTADPGHELDPAVGGTCPAGTWDEGLYTIASVTADCTVSFTASLATTSLVASVSSLALSVSDTATHPALTGTPRSVTLQNTGEHVAIGLSVDTPALPPGSAVTAMTCGLALAPGASCTVTITPGSTASADGVSPCTGGSAPVPADLSIAATNTNTVTVGIVVLGYGCIYQGGHLFAVDDTTPATGSIGGKVATTLDQAAAYPNGLKWAADPTGDTDYTVVDASSLTDGAANTAAIVATYPATPLAYYAAGTCQASIAGQADWYLPAQCEMGPVLGQCPAGLQTMQQAVVDYNGLNLLSGFYWTSTEVAAEPQTSAWVQYFEPLGGNVPVTGDKTSPAGVRCARALTP